MVETYDVVVIGAGVAGLRVSGLLGGSGLKVCLVDLKKDLLNVSFHTLGSFIDVGEFGLSRNVIASEISECVFHSKRVHSRKKISAYILDKVELHRELLERALQNGVSVKTSTKIVSQTFNAAGSLEQVGDSTGNGYHAKIFVDATGVSGFLSKKIGLQDSRLKIAVGLEYNVRYLAPQSQAHLFIGAAFRGGYGWIFPLKNGRAIVGYGTFHKESVARLKQKLDAALHGQPMAELVLKDNAESYGGTIPAGPVKNTFVRGNIVCVGDSVSQVNPVVGEGYRFIMEAAALAARSITEAVRASRLELLGGYDTAWSQRFEKAYRKSKRIQLLADLCGRTDALSDLACLVVRSMSNARFQRNLAANF